MQILAQPLSLCALSYSAGFNIIEYRLFLLCLPFVLNLPLTVNRL